MAGDAGLTFPCRLLPAGASEISPLSGWFTGSGGRHGSVVTALGHVFSWDAGY